MPTVLLVDDDPAFLTQLEQILAQAGYAVLHAHTGRDAIDLLEKKHNEIDLTVVDLALPDINGFEIIGALSRRPNRMKIIAMTGAYKDSHLQMAGALGAHAAIRKPPPGNRLSERDWLGTVHRLIGSPTRGRFANAASAHGADNAELPNGTDTD